MTHHNLLTNLLSLSTKSLVKTATAVTMLGTMAAPALADPPVDGALPVFCFRIMNITNTDTDRFLFEFEVLNWTDQEANDLEIALTTASDVSFVSGSGGVSPTPHASAPGNQVKMNDWSTGANTSTMIEWNGGTAIPNIDLVQIAADNPGDPMAQIAAVQMISPTFDPFGDPETIDNGDNVLSGFTLEVDDFQAGELLSFNWFLTKDGNTLGTADGAGNAFGFGTVSIARQNSDGMFPDAAFPGLGNTGFKGGLAQFAEGANIARQPQQGISPFVGEVFGAEFGAGITAPFMNPADSEAICGAGGCPLSISSVPEPETNALALLGLATMMGVGSWVKGQHQKK